MLRTLKNISTLALIAGIYLVPLATKVQAQTQAWTGRCVDAKNSDVATIQGLECMIANVLTVFISVIGLAAFVMFIVGSFRWMLSGGDSKGVGLAKGSMTYAVVGIVVSLSAYVILNMISSFTGVSAITIFRIPDSGI